MNQAFKRVLDVLVIALLGVALFSGGQLMYFLFVVVLTARISAFLLIKHFEKSVYVLHTINSKVIHTGELLNIEYRVYNTSYLPLPHAEIVFDIDSRMATEAALKEIALINSQDFLPYVRGFACPYRGFYEVGKVAVKVYDPLMLYQREMVFEKAIDVTVYPQIVPLEGLLFEPEDAFGTLKANRRALSDQSNLVNIRPYEKGDSLKNIHWKLSAKQDDLMTKEFDETVISRLVIYLDGYADHFKMGLTRALEESMVSFCLSLINERIQKGIKMRLYLNGIEPEVIDVENSGDFQKVLEALTRFESVSTAPLEQFMNHYTSSGDHTVVITPMISDSLIDRMKRTNKQMDLFAFAKLSKKQKGLSVRFIDDVMDVAYEN